MAHKVRTRFAPSPTGFLHVGGVRTALFAWLLARQKNGKFILRLEDTDKTREVAGSDKHIMNSLTWLGINWDGEIYRQSEHLDLYKEWGQKLVDKGRAYADPYSAEELDKLRKQAKTDKKPFLFRNHRPKNPPSWDGSHPLRFLSEPKAYQWHDEVMGDLSAGEEAVDDFIMIKSDGFPTYNFAHIIDDNVMQITHVIRSQEFLASVPRYLNLYEALGIERPFLATLPFVMGPDGKKKLSKRDGAKDILDYAREGYVPEAMVNFLATLGWNDGTKQEIFSIEELISKFNLNRVQKSGAKFDEQRLIWIDGAHIRSLALADLYKQVADFWPSEADSYDNTYRMSVLKLVQERLKFFKELPELTIFFFKDMPVNPSLIENNKQLKKLNETRLKELLQQTKDELKKSNFSAKDLTERLNSLLEKTGEKPGVLFSLIRIATTQVPASPGLAETLVLLGKDRSLARLEKQIDNI